MNREIVSLYSELLQNMDQIRKVPIIAFSGFVNENIEAKCLRTGFDFCLQAPLTKEKISEGILSKIAENKTEQ